MKRNTIVCVTGACGKIAYSLYNSICSGQIFGNEMTVELRLLDLKNKIQQLRIIKEQLEDCCYENVSVIKIFNDQQEHEAFLEVDVVIFLGAIPRRPGMDRNQVFQLNAEIFQKQGKSLNLYAKKTCKSLVIANPANTNCLVLANNAPSIPKKNFTALTRLDYNRFIGQTAKLFECKVQKIRNIILWGNHSRKQFCDVSKMEIDGESKQFIDEKIKQLDFVKVEKIMYDRGGFILEKAHGNAYIASTKAIIDHLKDWLHGSDRAVSMGVVLSLQKYGIPEGLCFSLPTICVGGGQYKIMEDIEFNFYQKQRITESIEELLKERSIVEAYLI